MTQGICLVDGCDRSTVAWDYCDPHYRRAKKYGDPLAGPPPRPRGTLAERLWAKVDKNGPVPDYAPHLGPCWLWTAKLDRHGYGWIRVSTTAGNAPAHRMAYELATGERVDPALDMDHLCRNHTCVNPSHLEPVTHRENMLRGNTVGALNVVKTHCPLGHPYDEANTRWKHNHTKRDCKTCDRIRQKRKRDARAALSRKEAVHP